ncbi:MAG: RagB/SusD family nutrient uptake outer membrane protein [Bacteroides sp.]|nr:RagB/SusD family nutrient uptake outer membrane protein [Bacteroides sp.]
MKKIYKSIISGMALILTLGACSDYLNQVPQDILDFERLFETRDKTLNYLASVYTYMPDEFYQRSPGDGQWNQGPSGVWTAGCNEAEYVWGTNASNLLNTGSLTPDTDIVKKYWGKWYKGIRTATTFMDNLHLCNKLSPGDYEQWHAEARAVRAIYYYYLLRIYGPLPIIEESISEQSSIGELQIPRNSVEEVVNYILDELDEAINNGLLPNVKTGNPTASDKGLGHIDQAVAKAFKVQVRMLAASDLFNGSNSYFASLENPDGKKLFPSYSEAEKKALWAAAAKEAKEFIDNYIGKGYDLTRIYTDGKLDPYLSYREAVRGYKSEFTNFTGSTSAIEMVWYIQRTYAPWEQYSRTPKHFGVNIGWIQASGVLGASQEIVDAYFMANGKKPITGYQSDNKTPMINSESGHTDTGLSEEDYLDPVTGRVFAPKGVTKAWTNREPRFYADITFDGQKWLYDGQGDIYTSTQYSGNSGMSQGATNDYTKTGYIVRKSAPLEDWNANNRAYILMRVAQLYLDYAEALNESDPGNSDVLKYLNLIRERAGIPGYGTAAGQVPVPSDMRQAIRDERRVELAFENVYYFDSRRWCIAEQTESTPIHGMDIRKDGEEFFVRTLVEDRSFEKKNYFFPIPNKDINISRALVQNPGW